MILNAIALSEYAYFLPWRHGMVKCPSNVRPQKLDGSSRWSGYFLPTSNMNINLDTTLLAYRFFAYYIVWKYAYSDAAQDFKLLSFWGNEIYESKYSTNIGWMGMGLLGLKLECLFVTVSSRSHLLSISQISYTKQTCSFLLPEYLQLIVVGVRENKERI